MDGKELIASAIDGLLDTAGIEAVPITLDEREVGVQASVKTVTSLVLRPRRGIPRLDTRVIDVISGSGGLLGSLGLGGLLGGASTALKPTSIGLSASVTWYISESDDPELRGKPVNPEVPDETLVQRLATSSGLSLIDVVPVPRLVEMLAGGVTSATTEALWLHATLHVRTDAVTVGKTLVPPLDFSRDLPPVRVPRAVIPVPRTCLLHIHAAFAPTAPGINLTDPDYVPGAGVLLVHPATGLAQQVAMKTLVDTVASLQNAFRAVANVGGVASFLLGLDDAQNALTSVGQGVHVVISDRIEQLNDITVVHNDWDENDIEMEDEVSSLLVTGAPGQRTGLYNDDEWDGDDDGQFDVTTGPFGLTTIASLDSLPVHSTPPGMVKVVHHPDDDTFDDSLSSIRFL